jgi:inorganic pyrophosphatase
MTARRPPLIALCLVLGCASAHDPTHLELSRDARPPHVTTWNPDGTVNALIEIPAGTNAKWEATSDASALAWERLDDGTLRVVQYLAYPANYGMVPGTLLDEETGGDGDPLDILVLGRSRERGALVPVRVIGALALVDDGEIDDKLLGVPRSGVFSEIQTVKQLDERFPGALSILAAWFTHYKGPGRIEVQGFRSQEAAIELIQAARPRPE